MTPEERAELLAAMYDTPEDALLPDDEEGVKPSPMQTSKPVDFSASGKYVTFMIDGKSISVPSAAYVESLEKKFAESQREMLQAKSQIKAIRQLVNSHVGEFNDVWRELDRKINLRDV